MFTLTRTNSSHTDFIKLVRALDAELDIYNGDENKFYSQFNAIDSLQHTIVLHQDKLPIACGAFKPIDLGDADLSSDKHTVEIKRMYVLPEYRSKGAASQVLHELERWASALGHTSCVLETGKFLKPAVALYTKSGYAIIQNYGQYEGVEESVCFEKKLY